MNRLVHCIASSLLIVLPCTASFAAIIASDSASDSAYADGWQGLNPEAGETPGMDNGGFGFLPWDFDGGFWDPADSPYPAAHFIDGVDVTLSGENNLGPVSFGLTNGNQKQQGFTSVATRPFESAMRIGAVFSMDIDNSILDPVDNGAGSSFSVDFESVNGDTRLSLFAFSGFNGDQWTVEDLNGGTGTGIDDTAGSNGFSMTMEVTGVETYELTVTPFGGSTSTFSGFFKRPGFGDIGAVRITLFGNGSGNGANSANGEHELFFDNLKIEREIPCDFDLDGDCDLADVDALTGAGNLPAGLAVPPTDAKFDLTNDSLVNSNDLTMWLTTAATENGLPTPYKRGDIDLDADVDTSDLTNGIINFTGAGGSGKVWSTGDNDGDGDVDTSDLTTAIVNFTGASAGTPNVPDLIYDPTTGEVTIDADGADVISFSLQSGPFNAADFSELPAGLTDNIANQIGWTSFNLFSGLVGTADLGAILPAGLDLAGLEAALTTASYGLALSGGGGGGRLDIIIPEPASMGLILLTATPLLRRKRRIA